MFCSACNTDRLQCYASLFSSVFTRSHNIPSSFFILYLFASKDQRLAVCHKCKKNYKTREMCRVRNGHTIEPWNTAYVCVTLDDSCTDVNGKYVDKPFTMRMIQWMPVSEVIKSVAKTL